MGRNKITSTNQIVIEKDGNWAVFKIQILYLPNGKGDLCVNIRSSISPQYGIAHSLGNQTISEILKSIGPDHFDDADGHEVQFRAFHAMFWDAFLRLAPTATR